MTDHHHSKKDARPLRLARRFFHRTGDEAELPSGFRVTHRRQGRAWAHEFDRPPAATGQFVALPGAPLTVMARRSRAMLHSPASASSSSTRRALASSRRVCPGPTFLPMVVTLHLRPGAVATRPSNCGASRTDRRAGMRLLQKLSGLEKTPGRDSILRKSGKAGVVSKLSEKVGRCYLRAAEAHERRAMRAKDVTLGTIVVQD